MKNVYFFSKDFTEGSSQDKYLLGGKGANLAQMTTLGLPVPPGFTISTEVCRYYYEHNRQLPETLKDEVNYYRFNPGGFQLPGSNLKYHQPYQCLRMMKVED